MTDDLRKLHAPPRKASRAVVTAAARPPRERDAEVLQVEPGDAFSEHANFGDATAADLTALEMPSPAVESDDLDATSVGVVDESDFIQNVPNSSIEFGGPTETWSALRDHASENEPTPLFPTEIVSPRDLEASLPTGDGFGESTESWSPMMPEFDDASDGTIEGVTLEPGPPARPAAADPRAQSGSNFPDEDTPVHSPPLPPMVIAKPGPAVAQPGNSPDAARPLRLPTKPAVDRVRPQSRVAPPPVSALAEEKTASGEPIGESLDIAVRRRPMYLGLALLSVLALFALGFLLSRLLA